MENNIENNNLYCVYHHLNPINKEIFYVGIGILTRPYSIHDRNKFWKNYVAKNGFEVKIIAENVIREEACILEIEWIKLLGRRVLGTGNLVNITEGGDGGWEKGKLHSKERNLKISITHKAMPKEKHSWYGKHHTDETKIKMSNSKRGKTSPNKGKPMSEEQKIKISISSKIIIKCPHCENEGARLIMTRWHFDNCKIIIKQQ
jgi:hypothetical protein